MPVPALTHVAKHDAAVELPMTTTITVRGLGLQDKAWLRHEAQRRGVSMAALVRQLIHERRERAQRRAALVEAFKRHFGPEQGVELPVEAGYGYRRLRFEEGHKA